MLSKLAEIAHNLDLDGHNCLADKIDLVLLAADDTDEVIKNWLKRSPQRQMDSHTQEISEENAGDYQEPRQRHELDIATRHQIELDKQALLQDVAAYLEETFGQEFVAKVDNSHKLAPPSIRMNFEGIFVTLAVEPTDKEGEFMVLASIDGSGKPDSLIFPISLKKPVGPIWADTVASAIARRLYQRLK